MKKDESKVKMRNTSIRVIEHIINSIYQGERERERKAMCVVILTQSILHPIIF